jgi:hypothetical protein
VSIVHESDAYGRLAAFCRREGYALELTTLKKGMMLIVLGPKGGRKGSALFHPGQENEAATYLLGKLKAAA